MFSVISGSCHEAFLRSFKRGFSDVLWRAWGCINAIFPERIQARCLVIRLFINLLINQGYHGISMFFWFTHLYVHVLVSWLVFYITLCDIKVQLQFTSTAVFNHKMQTILLSIYQHCNRNTVHAALHGIGCWIRRFFLSTLERIHSANTDNNIAPQ